MKLVDVAKEKFARTALSAKREQGKKYSTLMLIEASKSREVNPSGTSTSGGKRRMSPWLLNCKTSLVKRSC